MITVSATSRALAILLLAPLHVAICQEIASLRAGETIRLSVASPANSLVQGRLISVSPDSIVVSRHGSALATGFSNVRLLEVKRRSGGSFMRSIAFGLLGGVTAGAVTGLASGSTNTGDGILTATDKAVIGSVLGGGAGLIGGTVFGMCCSSSWQPMLLPANRNVASVSARRSN
jgi:hypothetical protein